MLSAKQPTTYDQRPGHDLLAPPSTSQRLSRPPDHSGDVHKHCQAVSRSHSPSNQGLSAPHCNLPPPATIALSPQQAPATSVPPFQYHGHQQSPPPLLPARDAS